MIRLHFAKCGSEQGQFPKNGVRGVPGGGGARLLVSCVLMREQKPMRKGTLFELGSAQRCHHLG